MNFDNDTDADLLGYMAEQADEAGFAKEAFGEFYARHRAYLFGVTYRIFGAKLGGEEGAADLVQQAFHNAYRWVGRHAGDTEAFAGFRAENREKTKRRVRSWLGTIAENLFKDILRSKQRNGVVELTDELLAVLPTGTLEEAVDLACFPPGAREALAQELVALKPEDRDIISMCLPWYDTKTSRFAFSPGEAENLAASLGIEVDTLRQRRHRAMKRLKQAVLARLEKPKSKGGTR